MSCNVSSDLLCSHYFPQLSLSGVDMEVDIICRSTIQIRGVRERESVCVFVCERENE